MSLEIDDLNAAFVKVSDAVVAAVEDIKKLAQELADAQANSDGPAVEDVASKMNALADTLNAAIV